MLRFSCLAVIAVAAGFIASGCGRAGGPNNGLSTKNEVFWYIPSDIEGMNPFLTTDESANYVQSEIWENLTGANPRNPSEYLPLLAGLPEQSADHLTWTFSLNQGAHWSDGQPVTAADVIFSYKTILDPAIINASAIRGYFGTLDSVYYPNGDQTKAAFHFSKYRYDLLNIINYVKILPKHVFDPTNLTDKMNWADLHSASSSNPVLLQFAQWFQSPKIARDAKYLIGSGPYKFKDWITNDRVILQRDTNYWGKDRPWQDAYPDIITFKTIKDQNAALTALKSKDIDIDWSLTAPQYLTQLDTAKFPYIKKDTVYENVYSYIAWNNIRPIFQDKNVRKALTMLIDRDEIIRTLLKGMSKKVEGPVAPTQPNYDPTVEQPAYNPEEAKKVLADAGWKDSDGDGILDKTINGKRVDFKFTFIAPSGNDAARQVLLVISNELSKAGIKAQISQIEWSVYLLDTKQHNYDAAIGAWVGNTTEDEIGQLWESSQSQNEGSNYYSYSDPKADAIMEAIKVEPDQSKRFAMSRELQHIIVDDQPVTFMYSSPDRIAWIDRFDNFEFFHTRPPYSPQYWIVRGSGVKRNPHGIAMSRNADIKMVP